MKLFSFLLLAAVVCLGATEGPAKPPPAKEPTYEGRTLSQWIALAIDKDPEQRSGAASALQKIGPPAVLALTELLKDKDSTVRARAAQSLGHVFTYAARTPGHVRPEAKTAVPALMESLKDKDSGVRKAAAYALGWIGPEAKTAIQALTELLNDKDSGVRMDAAWALGNIRPEAKTPIPALMELLNDRDLEDCGLYHWMTAWNNHVDVRKGLEKLHAVVGELLGRKPTVTALALPELLDERMRAEIATAVQSALGQHRSVVTATIVEDREAIEIDERPSGGPRRLKAGARR